MSPALQTLRALGPEPVIDIAFIGTCAKQERAVGRAGSSEA